MYLEKKNKKQTARRYLDHHPSNIQFQIQTYEKKQSIWQGVQCLESSLPV